MIRPIEARDLPKLQELHPEFDWTFGRDYMQGLVLVDQNDVPRLFAGAWRRAEVHLAVDASWESPGMRLAALKALHDAMEVRLSMQGVGQVVTWFGDAENFVRRLARLGWVQSNKTSWHRRCGNG